MKRLLLTTITAFALSCVPSEATMVMLDYFGETHVTSNNIERTMIVNSDDGRSYNIAMRPLDEEIISSNGETRIPLEYLFINNTREDVFLKYNEYSNVIWGATMEEIPRVMTAKIKEYKTTRGSSSTVYCPIYEFYYNGKEYLCSCRTSEHAQYTMEKLNNNK